ncbi:4-carboxy-4-hydroxy-2-oxoadipate aldolase/oxaloacetate decarboxylase [Ramlibacter sp. G-1-2-2]|uniref:Putative 4-hydroxy-4-methyl-2-oxoglutarate aldolase n=1 Tax=Ramlibacter agri TaxID=2728837 RepID=A0A848H5D4_9BURK|nr:4-carboxy-4-hydroxy-2-oxoadipate aldolase/oxaloacetate decarboxylase [Ramlibacter agri]NML44729.1 4-carboxy-4-hydroxy-2-oxoadipate aldolase/oxaloacetate decarboxylase [Ramlibacter agri]
MKRHDPAATTRTGRQRVAASLVHEAAKLPTATLHEAAGKIGALPSVLKPMAPGFRFAGPALTVHAPPGDNLWLHRALDIAQPGDVLVAFCSGAYEHGYWGEIMSTMAQARKMAGLVIDGCVRDGVLLAAIGFPVFARGLCIRGTGKDFGATGWINHPVLMGDVVVQAGDLVVGDGDGVVAIPAGRAEQVLAASHAREAQEAAILERLRAGASTLDVYGWR